jgi:ribulose-bisphosphate carboxylase large chain
VRPEDIPGFFATRAELDAERYVELDVTFECAGDPLHAAAALCSEQSTTQWSRVGTDEDFRPRYAARIVEFDATPRPAGFSYEIPNAPSGSVHACRVTIAHPHGNFGARFPNLMTSVMGEGMFFAPGIPIVRLEDIRFPASFLAEFAGPKFGLPGIRERLQAYERPIFIGVIKPNIGLPPAPFAELGEQALLGGLDIVKDDEMLTDTPWSPLAERAALLGAASARAAAATGVPKMYMANVTDEVTRLPALHDVAVAGGAGCLLVNALPVGLSGVRLLAAHAQGAAVRALSVHRVVQPAAAVWRALARLHPVAAAGGSRCGHHARLRRPHDDAGARGARERVRVPGADGARSSQACPCPAEATGPERSRGSFAV